MGPRWCEQCEAQKFMTYIHSVYYMYPSVKAPTCSVEAETEDAQLAGMVLPGCGVSTTTMQPVEILFHFRHCRWTV